MYNTYNQYPNNRPIAQQQQPQMYNPFGLKGRPVASIEEAKASAIDFDGSVFFFPDLANRRIYTKQINMDGTSSLNVYELKEIPVETSNNFITREEFNTALTQMRAQLNQLFMPVQQQPNVQPQPQQKEEIKNF